MEPLPHYYPVVASTHRDSNVRLTAPGIAAIKSAAPLEFGGPGDLWSPESLLCAAVADCFVLSFRAIAGKARLAWEDLDCKVVGTLDRRDGVTRFVGFSVEATLTVPAGADEVRAGKLLEKSEQACLVTNSLSAPSELRYTVRPMDQENT